MSDPVDAEQVRAWIDDDLVTDVERVPDEVAEFNFTVELSNILVHIIRREPGGPLLVGQQIEYGRQLQSRIKGMDENDRTELLSRIREVLTTTPGVYGFHDERGNNVPFQEVYRIFVEYRIYPDAIDQHVLMSGLVDIWKTMRYLDDIVTLIESVEGD